MQEIPKALPQHFDIAADRVAIYLRELDTRHVSRLAVALRSAPNEFPPKAYVNRAQARSVSIPIQDRRPPLSGCIQREQSDRPTRPKRAVAAQRGRR